MDCSCNSLSGNKPLFPQSVMFKGRYWILEHMYPSPIKGWLVLILKRHLVSLHKLKKDEYVELGTILSQITPALSDISNCKKEYVLCFAEKEHFKHIHFHIIAIPKNLPEKYKGTNIFKLQKEKDKHMPKNEIVCFCKKMEKKLS